MQWSDDGIVLGVRRHGESSAILEAMTRDHGRHLGLVRGGASSRMRPVLQPGNTVRLTWRARLDEHLGHYAVEGLELRAAFLLTHPHAAFGVTYIAALCRLLPERDPHLLVTETLDAIVTSLSDPPAAAIQLARFELMMLRELGFGLDLRTCAATGVSEELAYVSPKSGRAVSREAGAPWSDKLFRLPGFLSSESAPHDLDDIQDAFALTGFFLTAHVFEPRGIPIPESRASTVTALLRKISAANLVT